MKNLFTSLILLIALGASAQDNYPLPSTQIYGNLTVDSVFANTNGNTGYQLINDSLATPGESTVPFSGSAYNDQINDVYLFTGISKFGDHTSTLHAYNYTTDQESEVSTNYFSSIGKQGILIKSGGKTGESMTSINVFDEVTVFAKDTTNAPAFNVMSWDGTGGRSDSLTMFTISRKGEAVLNGPSGSLGIGTNTPTATLDVVGTLQYVDGNQAVGKVLTSDADGNANWSNINTVNASTIPVFIDNAAAVTGIGTGKFYYVDVSGEYEVRISH